MSRRTTYDLGLECEINGTFGDGQFMGMSYNFTGLHGSFRLSGLPRAPSDLPQPKPVTP